MTRFPLCKRVQQLSNIGIMFMAGITSIALSSKIRDQILITQLLHTTFSM
jgi:hypothetical protein